VDAAGLTGAPGGEEPAPAGLPPGWHAVMSRVAADAVTSAVATLRTPIPYMKSPEVVQAPVSHRHSSLQRASSVSGVHLLGCL
jgi:hypothetical protein